jgi:hypothetical protein
MNLEQKPSADPVNSAVQKLLLAGSRLPGGTDMMSLVRLIGFTTLACGCVTGKYREIATHREVTYVEEKGTGCENHAHRRNHTLAPASRSAAVAPLPVARAS